MTTKQQHETFISELADGWYFFDPNVRPNGFGPFTIQQAEGLKHMRDQMAKAGHHSFQACPPYSRAMCSWRLAIASALNQNQEAKVLCD